ncbi:arginine-tRNA-protein transferase 1 [Piedraia hortae CBS 480.64]|uniref:arginyltransferase n=1 Tax=Piedraia hortae CBS 480.64 TaxID=1314780 RepID=A0A6A7BT98_9PEZI|nr:arginine-tRNA-protein transferase 1 [Piedraia hortae CBS 480.64]
MPSTSISTLRPLGFQLGDCGYCKEEGSSQRTPKSRTSYFLESTSLDPDVYQALLDRGWRRSGPYLYLPDLIRSCCPHYAIRIPVAEFKPRRDQRQALHRWNRFILGDKYLNEMKKKYPKTKEQKKATNESFDLVEIANLAQKSHLKPGLTPPEHQFETSLEPTDFTEEKYKLFHHYQRNVHHESETDISRDGFKRFLCNSPIHHYAPTPGHSKLGSYHYCFRLDGCLIAMSVIDLLPTSVSSVYFIYHTDFEKFSFGKLSALHEAKLCLEGGYKFYNMGYYIHSCPKMRYKADYNPQYVLDYATKDWTPLDDELKQYMSETRCVSISRERAKQAGKPLPEENYILLDPMEATTCYQSLFDLGMPGIMSLDEVLNQVDVGDVRFISKSVVQPTALKKMPFWELPELGDEFSLPMLVAEIVATIGSIAAKGVVIDLSGFF